MVWEGLIRDEMIMLVCRHDRAVMSR
jgi:hypothetical protein